MSETPAFSVPTLGGADHAHAAVRAVLSAIPYAGGAVMELFNAILTPPIEKRRTQWMNDVSQAIGKLYQLNEAIIERITGDEQFQSVLLQATWAAVRNHQQEKLQGLKNAVINSACGTNLQDDLQLLFVRYVDELTPTHLAVMEFLNRDECGIAQIDSYQGLLDAFLVTSEGSIDRIFFKLTCSDLESRGLIRLSRDFVDFEGLYQEGKLLVSVSRSKSSEKPHIEVTGIGRSFVTFVLREPILASA